LAWKRGVLYISPEGPIGDESFKVSHFAGFQTNDIHPALLNWFDCLSFRQGWTFFPEYPLWEKKACGIGLLGRQSLLPCSCPSRLCREAQIQIEAAPEKDSESSAV
jgi:hypothetical protein